MLGAGKIISESQATSSISEEWCDLRWVMSLRPWFPYPWKEVVAFRGLLGALLALEI